MNYIQQQIIDAAIREIESPKWAVTEQFLQIHKVVYDGSRPKVARIDTDKGDGTSIVYFPIEEQNFHLAVYVSTQPEITVAAVHVEPYNCLRFCAFSEKLTLNELASFTSLKYDDNRSYNIGDRKIEGSPFSHRQSRISFEPNPEPDEFEDKLESLLDFLEQDINGISALVDKANGYIQVAIFFHNGNTMLGGPHINKDLIKRMSALSLGIDFDLYAGGTIYK